MGTLLLEQIKKHTATFLQEKYNNARMAFTDVTKAELLTEQVTNKDACSPDAKTMTRIAEASFEIDDYWRIVDILHKRLYSFDWEQWRQSYNALVLLEFLLTHGSDDFAIEFQGDAEIIQELGSFTHVDERGFNWGARMQQKSDQIVKLLQGGETLREARLKALKITNEIQGFGSSVASPSSSPDSSSSEASPGHSSFCSFSSTSTPTYISSNEQNKHQFSPKHTTYSYSQGGIRDDSNIISPSKIADYEEGRRHLWHGTAVEEKDNLLDSDDENDEKPSGLVSGICSKLISGSTSKVSGAKIEFRCVSDVGNREAKKKFDRQNSLWY